MKMAFCNECGGELERLSDTNYRCENGHLIYNGTRGAVCVIFVKDGKVLYGIRSREPNKGKLTLPGGFSDYGEQPIDTLKREVNEELGIELVDATIIGAFTNEYVPNVTTTVAMYVAKKWRGTMKPDDDLKGLKWGSPDIFYADEFAWDWPGVSEAIKPYL